MFGTTLASCFSLAPHLGTKQYQLITEDILAMSVLVDGERITMTDGLTNTIKGGPPEWFSFQTKAASDSHYAVIKRAGEGPTQGSGFQGLLVEMLEEVEKSNMGKKLLTRMGMPKLGNMVAPKRKRTSFLGGGTYKRVFGGEMKNSKTGEPTGTHVAVAFQWDDEDLAQEEVDTNEAVQHFWQSKHGIVAPHVMAMIGSVPLGEVPVVPGDEGKQYAVTTVFELCKGGDLFATKSVMTGSSRPPEFTWGEAPDPGFIKDLFTQALTGVDSLHQAGVGHMDIKGDNLQLTRPVTLEMWNGAEDATDLIKVGDLGLAWPSDGENIVVSPSPSGVDGETISHHGVVEYRGTPLYMAPELIVEPARQSLELTDAFKADTFSLAVTIYTYASKGDTCIFKILGALYRKENPYEDRDTRFSEKNELFSQIRDCTYNLGDAKLARVLQLMLLQMESRPLPAELLQDPYFATPTVLDKV